MSELSPDAKSLFRKARAELEPDERQVSALRAAVAAGIARSAAAMPSPEGGASGGTSPVAATGGTAVVKVVGLGLVLGALGVGLALHFGASPHAAAPSLARPDAPRPVVVLPPAPPASGDWVPLPSLPSPPSAEAHPAANPSLASHGARSLPTVTSAGRTAARALPRATTNASPPTDLGNRPATDGAALDLGPMPPPRDTATEPERHETREAPEKPSLVQEIALLRDAHAALDRGDAQGALTLLHDHARRYPYGTLREEELALEVLALCALGRPDAARWIARELARSAPDSPHLAGIRSSCIGPQLGQ